MKMDGKIDLSNLSSSERDSVMEGVKQFTALQNLQELMQSASDKCIKACVTKPGTSLDRSEEKCLVHCMDRFMEVWNIVSRAYQQKLQGGH